jgi:hypothetical protein
MLWSLPSQHGLQAQAFGILQSLMVTCAIQDRHVLTLGTFQYGRRVAHAWQVCDFHRPAFLTADNQ